MLAPLCDSALSKFLRSFVPEIVDSEKKNVREVWRFASHCHARLRLPPSLPSSCFKDAFDLSLAPLSPGGPGEGPDCHVLGEICCLGAIPAWIRGVSFFIFIAALSVEPY